MTKARLWLWLVGGVAALAALAVLSPFMSGVQSGVSAPSLMSGVPDASRSVPCVLDAMAAWTHQLSGGNGGDGIARAIRIQNRGAAQWTDVEVTIRGLGVQATKEQAAGPHSLRLDTVGAGELVAKNIDEFKKADGTAWVPMEIRRMEIEIKASVNGRTCTYERQIIE